MNAPAQYTKETQQLTTPAGYNNAYNDAYNLGFIQGRQTPPTINIDHLNDDKLWYNRLHSAGYLLGIIIIALIAAACIYGLVRYIFLDLLNTGIQSYSLLAPLILLVVIGYYIRGKRNA